MTSITLGGYGSGYGYDYQSYNSGSRTKRELAMWTPPLKSADADILPAKGLTEARVHSLVHNTPMISGAITSKKDAIVGTHFKLNLTPIWDRLPTVGDEARRKWVKDCESGFHEWADDPDCWIDAQRKKNFVDFCRSSIASDLFAGEFLLSREWRPSPLGFKTCFMMVEPERMVTPQKYRFSLKDNIRGGVRVDSYGAPTKYYIRQYSSDKTKTKIRGIPRFNRFGQLQFLHVFESDRANSTRGMSPFAATIEKIKMASRYEDVELEAAILAATYSLYVESDLGSASVFDALKDGNPTKELNAFIKATGKMHSQSSLSPILSGGKKITQLFPGEKINMLSPNHPNQGFEKFERSMHQHISRAIGMSYEEYSGNYSDTTYNSARASMLAAWRFVKSKRKNVPAKVATFIFRAWLDEAVNRGVVKPPFDYFPNRGALSRCSWIGAGREDIDELKSARANKIKLETGETNLIQLAAIGGEDYEDLFQQREKVIDMKLAAIKARGITVDDALIQKIYLGS